MKLKFIFIALSIMVFTSAEAQVIKEMKPKFFSFSEMRLSKGVGANVLLVPIMQGVSRYGAVYDTTKGQIGANVYIGLDLYSPNSKIQLYAQPGLGFESYSLRRNGIQTDDIFSMNISIPLMIKYKTGSIERRTRFFFMAGGGTTLSTSSSDWFFDEPVNPVRFFAIGGTGVELNWIDSEKGVVPRVMFILAYRHPITSEYVPRYSTGINDFSNNLKLGYISIGMNVFFGR